jgi:hypothetical protein
MAGKIVSRRRVRPNARPPQPGEQPHNKVPGGGGLRAGDEVTALRPISELM